MSSAANYLRFISRGEDGPAVTGKEFDLSVYRAVTKLVKKYEIKYNPEQLLCTEEEMIDNTFRAGVELLLQVGVFNMDTGKIIRFSEEEITEGLFRASANVCLGEGKDAVKVYKRTIEDDRLPVICGGIGNPVSEELRYPLYFAYASNPMIDYIELVPPNTFLGRPVKAGSPFEIEACLSNIALFRKASRDAGRAGMPVKGKDGVAAITDIVTNHPSYGFRPSDQANVYMKPTLKVTYEDLNRVTAYLKYGIHISSFGGGYIGGIGGGVEGAVVCGVAEAIASVLVYNAEIISTGTLDGIYPNQSSRKALWGSSLMSAAVNKHMKVPNVWGIYLTTAGPGTEMLFYETAAATVALTTMGCHTFGVCPNQGVALNHCTPLESQFMGEIAYATAGLSRAAANEIVLGALSQYEDKLSRKEPDMGRCFQELYDVDKLEPRQDYIELKEEVWDKLKSFGLIKYQY